MGVAYIEPELILLVGEIILAVRMPPLIREALQPCTFGRGQAANDVAVFACFGCNDHGLLVVHAIKTVALFSHTHLVKLAIAHAVCRYARHIAVSLSPKGWTLAIRPDGNLLTALVIEQYISYRLEQVLVVVSR